MAQGRTPEKAFEGTFDLAVALEANPLGTVGRSKICVWSKPNIRSGDNEQLWPRLVDLTIKTSAGQENWQIVIDSSEILSLRRGFISPKDSPSREITPPTIEAFLERWEVAEINHHNNKRRRERRLIVNQ